MNRNSKHNGIYPPSWGQGGITVMSFCLASVLNITASAQQPQKHPNILWISTEDMSPHLGCYGDNVAKTPNIDRLAQQGVAFRQAYCAVPACEPGQPIPGLGARAVEAVLASEPGQLTPGTETETMPVLQEKK